MKEAFNNIVQDIKMRKTRTLVLVSTLVIAVFGVGIFAFYGTSNGNSEDLAHDIATSGDVNSPIVAVVGAENVSITGSSTSNNSWPGEIISLNNLQVQLDREGTISEWYVRIGERVQAGQTLGKLSRPPQTPEAVMALSEKAQMLSEARTSADALRAYTTKRIAQLKQLRSDTDYSSQQKLGLLSPDSSINSEASLSLIASKKKMAQEVLRGSISGIFPIITNATNVPDVKSSFRVQLKWEVGAVDSGLRIKFVDTLHHILVDLQDKNIVPEKSGMLYLETAIKLANASVANGEEFSSMQLEELKKMLYADQAEFVSLLGEIKSMELESVNTQRESIDTRAEIDAMIADMEKELALSEGEVKAKEVAYNAIKNSITNGYSIVAPKSGIISNIMKQPGEFVGPGMPVATVTASGSDGILVRMRIPSNVQRPQIGEMLSVVRPGFATDVQKARLIGVGSSLDEDGSYMADAVFVDASQWSVGTSVRVLAPASSSAVTIKSAVIVWGEGGVPTVWAISEADRIFAKKITIGRTIGDSIEVYEGLSNGDRYIAIPSAILQDGMFLSDIVKEKKNIDTPAQSGEGHDMGAM